jgi:hypothetical protein
VNLFDADLSEIKVDTVPTVLHVNAVAVFEVVDVVGCAAASTYSVLNDMSFCYSR